MPYFVKHKSVFWPAKSSKKPKNKSEVLKLKLLDNEDTEIEIECSKVKEFVPYSRIPSKRTNAWHIAYAKALDIFNNK